MYSFILDYSLMPSQQLAIALHQKATFSFWFAHKSRAQCECRLFRVELYAQVIDLCESAVWAQLGAQPAIPSYTQMQKSASSTAACWGSCSQDVLLSAPGGALQVLGSYSSACYLLDWLILKTQNKM